MDRAADAGPDAAPGAVWSWEIAGAFASGRHDEVHLRLLLDWMFTGRASAVGRRRERFSHRRLPGESGHGLAERLGSPRAARSAGPRDSTAASQSSHRQTRGGKLG